MKHIALIFVKLKYIHIMYTYTHKKNTTKQIETHSLVSTKKKKKNQIDYTKLSYRVPNSIINTKRNTAKTTIQSTLSLTYNFLLLKF